jgi:hypothetical protein
VVAVRDRASVWAPPDDEISLFDIWDALARHASWIEPSIVNRWVELLATYDGTASPGAYRDALAWPNVEHHTQAVRELPIQPRPSRHSLHCVCSANPLHDQYEIDHCFPFKHWPNNHLWNLLPTTPRLNSKKSDRLPSAEQLENAVERIEDWWRRGTAGED